LTLLEFWPKRRTRIRPGGAEQLSLAVGDLDRGIDAAIDE
jgi:hypothetical protein